MEGKNAAPQRIAMLANPAMPEARVEAEGVMEYLQANDINPYLGTPIDDRSQDEIRSGRYDLAIVLGGDGSMLRVGHLCVAVDVPVLGINLERFGFLIEVQLDR
ncbi:MAG: NAD(+)/NADH kinase [Chloroflexi bacterium]|nr:NAD(+)/NADH kinase [Chloroflexota bacterium]